MEFNSEDFAWESSDDSLWESEMKSDQKWTWKLQEISKEKRSGVAKATGSQSLEPKWSSELLEDSGIEEKLPSNSIDPQWSSGLNGILSDGNQNWTINLFRESNLEDKWSMELIEERLALEKLTEDCRGGSQRLTDYCDDVFPQNLLKNLGKKEGELEGFKELLNKAETALRQSEDAVQVGSVIYIQFELMSVGIIRLKFDLVLGHGGAMLDLY